MRTRSYLLLLLLASLPFGKLFAEQRSVVIGTGTYSGNTAPFCNYYYHGSTQIIYSAEDMVGPGTIYSIAFQVAKAKEYATTGIQIYMGHKSTGAFADNQDFVPIDQLTLVYSGTPTLGQETGWEEFVLSTPFEYDGTNLVIAIGKHAKSYDGSLQYQYTSKSNSVLYRYDDSNSKYGDMAEGIEYKMMSSRPNIRFNMDLPLTTVGGITYSCGNGEAKIFERNDDMPNDVVIPNSVSYKGKNYTVTSIPEGFFADNTDITSVTLPNTITNIPVNLFKSCTSLRSVNIPTSASIISRYSFYECAALETLTIPASVTTIDFYAFDECTGITSLTIEDATTPLEIKGNSNDENQFSNFKLQSLYLGRNVKYNKNTYSQYKYGSPFAYQTELQQLTIGPKVTEIGPRMFYNTGITELTIPANVTKMENAAFSFNSNLTRIEFVASDTPLTFENTDRGGFYYCSKLNTIDMNRNITFNHIDSESYSYGSPFSSCPIQELNIGEKVTEIAPYTFHKANKLTSITLPKSITNIGENAFYGCTGLALVNNYSSLDLVKGSTDNGYVTYYCNKLYNLDSSGQDGDFLYFTKAGIKYIYEYVGESTQITLPAGYSYIEGAFRDNTSLVSVTLPSGMKKIPAHFFHGCSNLSNVSLPEGITEIGDFAFCYCRSLTSIDLPSTLQRIGAGAFSRCKYLSSIDIPEGVTEIGVMAFKRCERLTSITLPTNITTIEPFTFSGCYNLGTIDIPEGVTSISNFAFYMAMGVKNVAFPSTLESIGRYAFSGCNLQSLQLPSGLQSIGEGAFKSNKELKSVVIPEGITEIADYTFNVTSLTDVILPESVTRIGRMAFRGCPIQYIKWPSHLTTIGFEAFAYSDGLKTPTIPSTVTNVGDMMFYKSKSNDGSLPGIYCYANAIVPTTTFHGTDMSNTVLYVRPELLAAYKASAQASIFADIRPAGDYNGDGKISVSDLVSIIEVNKSFSDYSKHHLELAARDINGDGNVTIEDINEAKQLILNPKVMTQSPNSVITMPSTPVPETYIPPVKDDCTLMKFDGGICTTESSATLELLNHIRWEACHEGVKDPTTSNHILTPQDYVEAEWSTDLERVARNRAAHTAVSQDHANMGSTGQNSWNGVSSYGECMGWYDFITSVYSYYDEKDTWVNNGKGVTGHYTALINKDTKYYGIAFMDGHISLLERASSIPEGASQEMLGDELCDIKVIDVYTKYIKDHVISGSNSNIHRYIAPTLELGKSDRLKLQAHLLFNTPNETNVNGYLEYYNRNVTFSSKTPEHATVTSDGYITALHVGNAVVEAALDGATVATVTIPITCTHHYDFTEADDSHKATATCTKCGEKVEGKVPTYFNLMWTNYTLNPMSSSSGVPSLNPVGSKIECHLGSCDGDEAFRDVCVEYLTPNLLTGPSEFHLASGSHAYFTVIGAGLGSIRIYLKSNPSYSLTFKMVLSEPTEASNARRRGAKPSLIDLNIPTFPLPELPKTNDMEE